MRVANEAKVGAVVLLALIVLGATYIFLRGLSFGADIYQLRILTPAHIAKGSDVRLQGVKVGQVREVTLDPETQEPLLTLAIRRNNPPFKLLKSYQYAVLSDSLISENYVDIRGAYSPSAPEYTPNDDSEVITGRARTPIIDATEVIGSLGKDIQVTMSKLNVTIDRINKGVLSYDNELRLSRSLESVSRLTDKASQSFGPNGFRFGFGDPRAEASLNNSLTNMALATRKADALMDEAGAAAHNINQLTSQFNDITKQNRGQLGALLGHLSEAADNVSGLTQTLTMFMRDSKLQENSQVAIQSFRRAAENVEAGTAGFKAMATDPKTGADIKEVLNALRDTADSARDTANSVKSLVGDPANRQELTNALHTLADTAKTLQNAVSNLNDVSTSLKSVVGDPALQANIKASAENLNGTLAATRAAAERVNGLLGGRRYPSSADSGGASAVKPTSLLPSGFDVTGRVYSDFSGAPRNSRDTRGTAYGDVTFNSEFFGGPFRLGLSNVGEGNDLTLQTGRFIGREGAVRYGLYRSKLGLGGEVHQGRFSLEGNVWDPNNHSANAYIGLDLTRTIQLLAGREDIGGVHANSIGVRLRP